MGTPNRARATGATKIAGTQILRKGLSPLATTISTARAISADTTVMVRGDSAFGSRAVVGTCQRHGRLRQRCRVASRTNQ